MCWSLDFKRLPLYIRTGPYAYSIPTFAVPSGTLTVLLVGEPVIGVCFESYVKGKRTVFEFLDVVADGTYGYH